MRKREGESEREGERERARERERKRGREKRKERARQREREGETPRVSQLQQKLVIKNALPWVPTVGNCLGPYGGQRGVAVSDERGSPVSGGVSRAIPVRLVWIQVRDFTTSRLHLNHT